MDIVFRVSVQELWAKFQLLRDGEEKWMMGARPEPGENLGSITPWLIEHEKEKFANTGVRFTPPTLSALRLFLLSLSLSIYLSIYQG